MAAGATRGIFVAGMIHGPGCKTSDRINSGRGSRGMAFFACSDGCDVTGRFALDHRNAHRVITRWQVAAGATRAGAGMVHAPIYKPANRAHTRWSRGVTRFTRGRCRNMTCRLTQYDRIDCRPNIRPVVAACAARLDAIVQHRGIGHGKSTDCCRGMA